MKLSPQEKAANKAAFQSMSLRKKIDHIFTYFWWLILLVIIAIAVSGSVLHRHLTRKEPSIYLALVNVAVGSDLEESLTLSYIEASGEDPKHREVYLYRDLYISEDADTVNHQYAYASRVKLMGAIQAEQLDAVVMNREAYDLLSASGYLSDISALLAQNDPGLSDILGQYITGNTVVISDNAIEWELKEADTHEVVTETVRNGVILTGFPLFRDAGFEGDLYFGIIANSTRVGEALSYIRYLAENVQ